jgi:hypothetical protein
VYPLIDAEDVVKVNISSRYRVKSEEPVGLVLKVKTLEPEM